MHTKYDLLRDIRSLGLDPAGTLLIHSSCKAIGLVDEEYGVGFRKGSDLAEELNQFFKEAYEDGSMMECAEKYGVQAAIIEQ